MKTMLQIVVALAVLAAASTSQAFTDDFDSNTGGNSYTWGVSDGLWNSNGWRQSLEEGVDSISEPTIIASGGIGGSQSVGATARVGAGRLTPGLTEVSMLANLQGGSSNFRMYFGDANSIIGPLGAGSLNLQTITYTAGNGAIGLNNHVNGSYSFTSPVSGLNAGDLGWMEFKIEYDAATSSSTASYRDVDDVTGLGGAFISLGSFASNSFTNLATGFLLNDNQSFVDNITTVPEPASFALALLGLGGFMMWRRRS